MMPGYDALPLPSIALHTFLRRKPKLIGPILEKVAALTREPDANIISVKVDLGNLDGDENFSALKFRISDIYGEKERTFNITQDEKASSSPYILIEGEPAKIW